MYPTKAKEEDNDEEFINKRRKGETLPSSIKAPSGRRLVQPQIISDNKLTDSDRKDPSTVSHRKPVEPQVLGEPHASGSDYESSSDDSSSGSGSSDEDEEPESVQITFVPKSKREDIAVKEEEEARRRLEYQSKEKKARQQRSREIACEAVARTEAEENGVATEDEADYPEDADESGSEEDIKAWKLRELARLSRDDKN